MKTPGSIAKGAGNERHLISPPAGPRCEGTSTPWSWPSDPCNRGEVSGGGCGVLRADPGNPISVGARGWCYILEKHGLRKGDFAAAETLITSCRKSGALPLNICADDDSRETIGLEDINANDVQEEVEDWIDYLLYSAVEWPRRCRLSATVGSKQTKLNCKMAFTSAGLAARHNMEDEMTIKDQYEFWPGVKWPEPWQETAECVDCRWDTCLLGEWYMVNDSVWKAAGMKAIGGCLCIGCLEERLGRTLTSDDFTDLPINDPKLPNTSSRLRARLGDQSIEDRRKKNENEPCATF